MQIQRGTSAELTVEKIKAFEKKTIGKLVGVKSITILSAWLL